MTYVYSLALVVLVVALAHVLGGWVWAGGFHKRGLRIQKGERNYGIWVTSLAGRRITLTASEPRQDIGHPGVLGLYWDGGYGQVGDVTDVESLHVTRGFIHLQGDQPPICNSDLLSGCPQVDLDPYAFPQNPSDVSLDFSEITYASPLGVMGAWLVEAPEADRWAIHVHGWTAERREALRILPAFNRSGVTSMVIDYRNDPGTPSDPTGRYRFGLTEWKDVEGAVSHALDAGAEDVVLIGYSTGAAHVMSFLERSALAKRVSGVVLDSPNIMLAEAVRSASDGLHIGPTPFPITRLMTEFGMWIADLRWGVDWDRTNYVQRAENILTQPTLVFHGTSDHTIPISVSRQLEARARQWVTLVEAPAAGHVMSWNADPDRYEGHLTRFLERI